MPARLTFIILGLASAVLSWDYGHAALWPNTCASGQTQSPINVTPFWDLEEAQIRYVLEYKWGDLGTSRVIDNGHYLVVH
ncbi:MAG: hypothetical protein P4M11_08445 [Candidatus Pacebacteria bacterium]|nr:hypothetical protein [Candidatus Paceibacterota bacterium]